MRDDCGRVCIYRKHSMDILYYDDIQSGVRTRILCTRFLRRYIHI